MAGRFAMWYLLRNTRQDVGGCLAMTGDLPQHVEQPQVDQHVVWIAQRQLRAQRLHQDHRAIEDPEAVDRRDRQPGVERQDRDLDGVEPEQAVKPVELAAERRGRAGLVAQRRLGQQEAEVLGWVVQRLLAAQPQPYAPFNVVGYPPERYDVGQDVTGVVGRLEQPGMSAVSKAWMVEADASVVTLACWRGAVPRRSLRSQKGGPRDP
jgi:hypothetical protein